MSCATWASRSRRWPPTTRRPAGGPSRRSWSTTSCSIHCSTLRPRSTGAIRRSIPTGTSSVTSASCAATRAWSATSSSKAPTRSACRTRRSSGSRRRSPCPIPAARASSSTSPPSGSTRTGTRSRPASDCPTRPSGSCSAASAARSGHARTSACRSTRVSSRCGSGVRCASPTAAARASSATSTAIRRRSGCAITPRPRARSSRSRRAWCSTAGRTPPRRRRYWSTASPTPRARTAAPTPSSTGTPCGRTTCRAGRCGVSASCRRASPTNRRWTGWRPPAGSIRSRSACATRCGPGIG